MATGYGQLGEDGGVRWAARGWWLDPELGLATLQPAGPELSSLFCTAQEPRLLQHLEHLKVGWWDLEPAIACF